MKKQEMGDIARLPKWAQEHIRDLTRQREVAVKALHDWSDAQSVQPISVSEMECIGPGTPEHFTRYIKGRYVTVKWIGVELNLLLREDAVQLSWGMTDRSCGEVAFIPTSFQQARLVPKDLMHA